MILSLKNSLKFLIFFFLGFSPALAEKHDIFQGIAKQDGKIVYLEKHDVTFDDKDNVLEAKTVYTNPAGKTLAVLKSDFRKSLSLPDHVFVDERTKSTYGIRHDGDKVILFNQDPGKLEATSTLDNQSDRDRIQVGCQGFNYFLKGQINHLKEIKNQPVLFMIPGELSTYKFVLHFVSESSDQIVSFKVKIENWLLRAFAPELEFRYDRKINRIVWYKGISNIKNDQGKTMNVTIDYEYK